MNRKFLELTPSEQNQFRGLAGFFRETGNEDIVAKLNVVKRYNLAIDDPIVLDFLTNVNFVQSTSDLRNVVHLSPEVQLMDSQSSSFSTVEETAKSVKKNKKKEMTYANSEDLIIIQNRLLHAISHLTLNERRLVLYLSPIIRRETHNNQDQVDFFVNIQEFAKTYNLKGNSVYAEVRRSAESIQEKTLSFWDYGKNSKSTIRNVEVKLNWVTKTTFFENDTEILVRFDREMIEMLTVFDKSTGNFWTQYQKEWIINLGTYGIIMLEMILSSREINGYYTIKHLREKFDCISSYSVFSDFKRYVIDKAIKEIEKYTPIKISYEVDKSGKTVRGLRFFHINTSAKKIKENKNNQKEVNENNPFVNFKMTPKQLAVFGAKISKKINKDIEEVIDEMSNVHFQSRYVECLKLLDFVPSDWYSDEEIKDHLTADQIAQEQQKTQQIKQNQKMLEQKRFEQDFVILLENAEEFVLANKKRVSFGIEKMYLDKGDYKAIVKIWEHYLRDSQGRKGFVMIDEILLGSEGGLS